MPLDINPLIVGRIVAGLSVHPTGLKTSITCIQKTVLELWNLTSIRDYDLIVYIYRRKFHLKLMQISSEVDFISWFYEKLGLSLNITF